MSSNNATPDHRRATGGRPSATRSGRPDGRQGRERIAKKKEEEAAAAKSRRSRRRIVGALVVAAVLVIGVVVAVTAIPSTPPASPAAALPTVPGPMGPEAVPIEQGPVLASATGSAAGPPVDGVECNSSEQVAYHVHTHLSVYVDGVLRPIPAGIGIVSPVSEQTPQGVFDPRVAVLLLAARPRPGRHHPHRVAGRPLLCARPILRSVGSAAQCRPGGTGHRSAHRVGRRPSLPGRSAIDPAGFARGRPDRCGKPHGRTARGQVVGHVTVIDAGSRASPATCVANHQRWGDRRRRILVGWTSERRTSLR